MLFLAGGSILLKYFYVVNSKWGKNGEYLFIKLQDLQLIRKFVRRLKDRKRKRVHCQFSKTQQILGLNLYELYFLWKTVHWSKMVELFMPMSELLYSYFSFINPGFQKKSWQGQM